MADVTRQEATIATSVDELWDVLTDFERYPLWARDLKHVEVLERDDQGRGVEVLFRAAAMGRSTTYVLRYDYGDVPHQMPWTLVRGDIMRRLEGRYEFEPAADGRSTSVVYHLTVELIVPLPGFVKRRAENIIIHTALRELKAHVEGPAASAV